jgi:hypothetical protein
MAALDSATKYPSIPTYHARDPQKGLLLEEAISFSGDVYFSEKINGINTRIAMLPGGGYVIGSRDELLYAEGDLLANPAHGIVDTLRGLAARLPRSRDHVMVFFGEVYGGKVTRASAQYTGTCAVGYRMFDVATIPVEILTCPLAHISRWRETGGQHYLAENELSRVAAREDIALAPRLATIDSAELPTDVEGMNSFLSRQLPATLAALDEGAGAIPEGVVLRSADRSVIAKARVDDYMRTLKNRTKMGR